ARPTPAAGAVGLGRTVLAVRPPEARTGAHLGRTRPQRRPRRARRPRQGPPDPRGGPAAGAGAPTRLPARRPADLPVRTPDPRRRRRLAVDARARAGDRA